MNKKSRHHTLAFRGTDQLMMGDGVASYRQAIGLRSEQYDRAVQLSTLVASSQLVAAGLSFTGHSLGGGLASIAALRNGLPATTFNAAGLHPATIAQYVTSTSRASELITAYYVRGEQLSAVQDAGRVTIGLPTAYAAGLPYPRTDIPQTGRVSMPMSVVEVDLPEAAGRRVGLTPGRPANGLALHGSSAVLEALYRQAFPPEPARP
jgi:hypothetical protein